MGEGAMSRSSGDRPNIHGALSRRVFLRRSLATVAALPSAAAILAACSKPGANGPGGSGSANPGISPASPDNPVTWPMFGQPIADDTPIETDATLQVYNWGYYLWPALF